MVLSSKTWMRLWVSPSATYFPSELTASVRKVALVEPSVFCPQLSVPLTCRADRLTAVSVRSCPTTNTLAESGVKEIACAAFTSLEACDTLATTSFPSCKELI